MFRIERAGVFVELGYIIGTIRAPGTRRDVIAMQPAILFLDIDGVLSIERAEIAGTLPHDLDLGEYASPIAIAGPFLRLLDDHPFLEPVWLSAWGTGAWAWNEWARTRRWPVAYPLDVEAEARAQRVLPPTFLRHFAGTKAEAARVYLHGSGSRQVVWLEDGFTEADYAWALEEPGIHLVDTSVAQEIAWGRGAAIALESLPPQHMAIINGLVAAPVSEVSALVVAQRIVSVIEQIDAGADPQR